MLILTLIFVAVVFICVGIYYKEKHKFAKNIREPYGLPFFGVLFELYGSDSKGKLQVIVMTNL